MKSLDLLKKYGGKEIEIDWKNFFESFGKGLEEKFREYSRIRRETHYKSREIVLD